MRRTSLTLGLTMLAVGATLEVMAGRAAATPDGVIRVAVAQPATLLLLGAGLLAVTMLATWRGRRRR
jgi:hypothetical protein